MRILTVCTANQCRSVMAATALRVALGDRGKEYAVSSAGVAATPGLPAGRDTADAIRQRGWPDVKDHRSRHLASVPTGTVDLALAAERAHLVAIIETLRLPRHRAWVLGELAAEAELRPPHNGELLDDWLRRLDRDRPLTSFLGIGSGPHDLADPTGRGRRAHRRTLEEIERRVAAIVDVIPRPWPPDPPANVPGAVARRA